MASGLQNGHVTDDVTGPWKVRLMTSIRLERNISKTTWAWDFKFGTRLCRGMTSGSTNNFPWKWAWPRSRDPTIFGIWLNIPSKLLQLQTSNLVSGFDLLSLLFDCRVLHTMVHWEALRSAILATAWLLVQIQYTINYCITISLNNLSRGLPQKLRRLLSIFFRRRRRVSGWWRNRSFNVQWVAECGQISLAHITTNKYKRRNWTHTNSSANKSPRSVSVKAVKMKPERQWSKKLCNRWVLRL